MMSVGIDKSLLRMLQRSLETTEPKRVLSATRSSVRTGAYYFRLELRDAVKNRTAAGECRIEAKDSKTAIWVMPTNEELIVARQAFELLTKGHAS